MITSKVNSLPKSVCEVYPCLREGFYNFVITLDVKYHQHSTAAQQVVPAPRGRLASEAIAEHANSAASSSRER